jgi:nitrogen fixation NifU-like protein
MNDLDKFAEELQSQIIKDIKKRYSQRVIEHWQHPKNWGIMNNADGYGKITGPCGDTMEISIKVKDNKIVKCTYDTDGCGTTIACGSIITEMAVGQKIVTVRKINQKTILDYCGGLPKEDQHCALLAADTLQNAINDYESTKTEAWKKFYREP